MSRIIGVIGLGLIGGSMAKALNQLDDVIVYGRDLDDEVVNRAKLLNAIEGELTDEILSQADIVFLCLYPQSTIDTAFKSAPLLKKASVLIDCCGVKGRICKELEALSKEYDFNFIGGHPMAGIEHSGFNYSKKALFSGASMILVPPKGTDIALVHELKKLFISVGFNNVEITTPEKHDEIIAFTSQLAHVVSGAYIKSPSAEFHKGFSAGSYKDMTRVAKLKEDMWTELFLENKEWLLREMDCLQKNLNKYRKALQEEKSEELKNLLREGRLQKEKIDKEIF